MAATHPTISSELVDALKRLKLGRMVATLPDRLVLDDRLSTTSMSSTPRRSAPAPRELTSSNGSAQPYPTVNVTSMNRGSRDGPAAQRVPSADVSKTTATFPSASKR